MSTNKFLTITTGIKNLVTAISVSAGGTDANKIVATDASGKLDNSLLNTTIARTNTAQQFTGTQGGNLVIVPYNASLVLDLSLGNFFQVTLTGNVTSLTATNLRVASFTVNFIQDGTGGKTISGISSQFKHKSGTVPALTITAANTRSKYSLECDGTVIDAVMNEDWR